MSSASPINNFETNAGTFRSRPSTSSPATKWRPRVIDIQDLLVWAYREELPKDRGLGGSGRGEPCAVSPMFAMGAFGTRVDYFHREPGFPSAMGAPHPDALLVEAAVERLATHAEQAVDEQLDLAPDFGALGVDEGHAVRRALAMMPAMVARCAKLQKAPFWSSDVVPRPIYVGGNGRTLVVRREPQFSKALTGEEVEHEVIVQVTAEQKGSYAFGAYSPLQYEPDPQSVVDERAEYLVWWGALNALAADLADKLTTFSVRPPSARQRPWTDEAVLGYTPRRLDDISDRVASHEQRMIAAAHRQLGLRRARGERGSPRQGVRIRRVSPLPAKIACGAV